MFFEVADVHYIRRLDKYIKTLFFAFIKLRTFRHPCGVRLLTSITISKHSGQTKSLIHYSSSLTIFIFYDLYILYFLPYQQYLRTAKTQKDVQPSILNRKLCSLISALITSRVTAQHQSNYCLVQIHSFDCFVNSKKKKSKGSGHKLLNLDTQTNVYCRM